MDAIADGEFYNRPAGELLQPDWDSRNELDTTKSEIGSRNFAAQNDAHSKVALEAANEWFRGTALNRRNNPAKTLMLVVQQRLHTNDLSGLLIEHGWPSLVMPAIATEAQDYNPIESICGAAVELHLVFRFFAGAVDCRNLGANCRRICSSFSSTMLSSTPASARAPLVIGVVSRCRGFDEIKQLRALNEGSAIYGDEYVSKRPARG
jgi:hypothetical protein